MSFNFIYFLELHLYIILCFVVTVLFFEDSNSAILGSHFPVFLWFWCTLKTTCVIPPDFLLILLTVVCLQFLLILFLTVLCLFSLVLLLSWFHSCFIFYFLYLSLLKNVLFYYFRVYKYSAQRVQRRALIPMRHRYVWLLAALCVVCEMNLRPLEEYTLKYWAMHGPGVSLPWLQKESWLMNKNGLFIKFLFETFLLCLTVSTTMSLQRMTTFSPFAKPSDQCYTELFYSWACPLLASSHWVPIV